MDNALEEPPLVTNNKNDDFDNNSSINISHVTLNSDNHASAKALADFLSENNRNRSSLSLVLNDLDNALDTNRWTNLDSIKIKRNPIVDEEVSNEINIDDELDKNTTLTLNQTPRNYLKISVWKMFTVLQNLTENKL